MTLLERIEDAKGPSRELDAEIALLDVMPDWRQRALYKNTNGWAERGCALDAWILATPDGFGGNAPLPAYTASIDAAMTLVPEGFRILMDTDPHRNPLARCLVRNSGEHGTSADGTLAATPALALCAAALSAKSQ